jgi:hypothetical protein
MVRPCSPLRCVCAARRAGAGAPARAATPLWGVIAVVKRAHLFCEASDSPFGHRDGGKLFGRRGEHEIDYILFIQGKVDMKPNAEEVMDTKYVSMPELLAMMLPESGLLWSPWFRIIVTRFLVPKWWANLQETLTTQVAPASPPAPCPSATCHFAAHTRSCERARARRPCAPSRAPRGC